MDTINICGKTVRITDYFNECNNCHYNAITGEIVINQFFLEKLNQRQLEATIYHEIGHSLQKTEDIVLAKSLSFNGKHSALQRLEYEADEYSAKKGYKKELIEPYLSERKHYTFIKYI